MTDVGAAAGYEGEFLLAFNQICSERNLPKEVVLEALTTGVGQRLSA
ncbi:MAG: hypothetical protein U0559_04575 [Anaerolineae bacterium]